MEDPTRRRPQFRREWCAGVYTLPPELDVVRYWDFAAIEKIEFDALDWDRRY